MSYFEYRQFDMPEAWVIDRLDVGNTSYAEIEALSEQYCRAVCRAALRAHHQRRLFLVDFVDTTVDPVERTEVSRVGKPYAPEVQP